MSQHTKGPWAMGGRCGNAKTDVVSHDQATAIASVWTHEKDRRHDAKHDAYLPYAEGEANARLIAAAPDMLDGLREIEELIQGYVDSVDGPDGQPQPNKAMQASMLIERLIAKATK